METASTKSSQVGSDVQSRFSNPWDKWLYMELKWRSTTNKTLVCLDLTINFGEHWFTTALGDLKFGFSGGDLVLGLKNGSMPIAARNPKNNLQPSIEVKRVYEEADTKADGELSGGLTAGMEVGVTSIEPSVSLEFSRKGGAGRVEKTQDEFKYSKWQIVLKGSPENPIWSFEVQNREPVLEGILPDYEIGTVVMSGIPCSLSAEFRVSKSEIVVTKAEGFALKMLTRNRDAVGTALVQSRLWKNLQPHVSRGEMHYA